jgi:hypothetical protein
MSAGVVEAGVAAPSSPNVAEMIPLARREARRIMTSPAILFVGVYVLLLGGVGSINGEEFSRAAFADFSAYIGVFFGIAVLPAVHLTATSARRSGAETQLSATPQGPLRRDLALCVGVVLGPGLVALAIALFGNWAAGGGIEDAANDISVEAFTLTDVLQMPAMAIGAGILAVVVARWFPFPGSLLIGLFGMMFLTLAVADQGRFAWLAWFHISSAGVDKSLIEASTNLAWHTAYLFAWSALGVAAVGMRQADRKRGWIIGFAVTLGVVVVTGLLQLPPYDVELFG